MAGRKSRQTGNPKMAGCPFFQIVAQVFKMVQVFEDPGNFTQHVLGFDGCNQASILATKKREIDGL